MQDLTPDFCVTPDFCGLLRTFARNLVSVRLLSDNPDDPAQKTFTLLALMDYLNCAIEDDAARGGALLACKYVLIS